jgi:hypothetical protein
MRERLKDLLLGLFWLVGVPVLAGTAAAVLAGWVTLPGPGSAHLLPVGATTGTHRAATVGPRPAEAVRRACASCPTVPARPTATAFVDVHPRMPATSRPSARAASPRPH